jgi:AraC-like DNA-binding protein
MILREVAGFTQRKTAIMFGEMTINRKKEKGLELSTVGREHLDWVIPFAHASFQTPGPFPQGDDRFQIVLILTGNGIAAINGERRVFIAPTVFCLNEKESFMPADSGAFSGRIVFFHPGIINSLFNFVNIRDNGNNVPLSASQDLFWLTPFLDRTRDHSAAFTGHLTTGPVTFQKIVRLFDAIAGQMAGQPSNWPCRGRSYLIELLFLLQQIHSTTETPHEVVLPEHPDGMDKVILHLYANFNRNIPIRELTDAFHTNRTTLLNRFHRATGTTVKSYLIGIRIRFASLLIRDTMLSLSEIIERVGFSDLTHFGRTFRKHTGHSPSDYRQKFCWMMSLYPDYRD